MATIRSDRDRSSGTRQASRVRGLERQTEFNIHSVRPSTPSIFLVFFSSHQPLKTHLVTNRLWACDESHFHSSNLAQGWFLATSQAECRLELMSDIVGRHSQRKNVVERQTTNGGVQARERQTSGPVNRLTSDTSASS